MMPPRKQKQPRKLAVAAVLALLTTIAIALPGFYRVYHRFRQNSSIASMTTIAAALECYRSAMGSYPEARSARALVAVLRPYSRAPLEAVDGWGRELRVFSTKESYMVMSQGRDGVVDIHPSARGH